MSGVSMGSSAARSETLDAIVSDAVSDAAKILRSGTGFERPYFGRTRQAMREG